MLERDGFRFGSEDSDKENFDTMVENGCSVDAFLSGVGIRTRKRVGCLDEKPRWLLSRRLRKQYERWCDGHDVEKDSEQMFGRRMKELVRSKHGSLGTYYALYCDDDVYDVFSKD